MGLLHNQHKKNDLKYVLKEEMKKKIHKNRKEKNFPFFCLSLSTKILLYKKRHFLEKKKIEF